jgi:hypothetical protein
MTISEEDTNLLAVAHSKDKQNHRTFVVPVINIQIMSWLFCIRSNNKMCHLIANINIKNYIYFTFLRDLTLK